MSTSQTYNRLNIKISDLPEFKPAKPDLVDALEEFRRVLEQAGLMVGSLPEATGKIVRVPTNDDKAGKKSGWYVLYDSGFLGGSYGNFKHGGEAIQWSSVSVESMTAPQIAEHHRLRDEAKKQREIEQQNLWKEAALYAQAIWENGKNVDSHAYLTAKKLKCCGKISQSQDHYSGWLMIPANDESGNISTLQFIGDTGEKRFLSGGRKKGCYHLIEGEQETIYIAEGFATSQTIHEVTNKACVVAWDAGNLMSVAQNIKAKFPNSNIIICADNDHEQKTNTGIEKAKETAEKLDLKYIVPACALGESDFNDVAQRMDIKDVLSVNKSPAEPLPLGPALTPPESFPLDALGPIMANAAQYIAERVQVPDAIAAQSLLSYTSLTAQGLYDIETLSGNTKPLSIFFLSVLHSGGRKTASDNVASAAIQIFEQQARITFKTAHQQYENEKAIWDKQRLAILKGKGTDQGSKLTSLGLEPKPPMKPILTVSEPTIEALQQALGTDRPSMGLFSDEGGQFLSGYSNRKETQITTATILSSLWDGSAIKRTRVAAGNTAYYGRRLTLHLMVQDGIENLLTSNEAFKAQGLLSRFLISVPTPLLGARLYKPEPNTAPMDRYSNRLLELLQSPLPIKSPDDWELETITIKLDNEAFEALVNFSDMIELRQAEGGDLRFMPDFASKVAEHAIRLAGVIHVMEFSPETTISLQTMQNGITLAEYYLAEAKRIRLAAGDTNIQNARMLLSWLKANWNEELIYLGPIMQNGPNAIRKRNVLISAIKVLERHYYLEKLKGAHAIDGAERKEVWRINT